MFIGHFAIAFLLISLFPGVPPIIPLIGVSFPDLLWPVLIFTGKEKAKVNPASPRQDSLVFLSYPYSHSLILGTLISVVPGAIFGFFFGFAAGMVFVVASASHWLLDAIVHNRDLPVLGFGRDTTTGAYLWKFGRAAFFIELIFYIVFTLLFAPAGTVVPLLVLGFVFQLINANSFFGFTRENPFKTPRAYATVVIFGFVVFILIANMIISGGWWNF
ncbi:MAG: hypothetical protein LUQ31_10840 [Methanoregula sp.]|nr:hypothetical protein [Methanoregula sp.]